MTDSSPSLTEKIEHISSELKELDHQLRSELNLDPDALDRFREALDSARLTAWGLSTLITAQRRTNVSRKAAQAFVAGERLRRLAQLLRDISADVDSGIVTAQTPDLKSLFESMNRLQHSLGKPANKS